MAGERWMQKESQREKKAGTKGSFSALASRHGRSTHAEAVADENKSGKVGKKARMAIMFEKARK